MAFAFFLLVYSVYFLPTTSFFARVLGQCKGGGTPPESADPYELTDESARPSQGVRAFTQN